MAEELTILRKPAAPPAPTLRDVALVLFRQRRLAALCFWMVFATVTLYGVLFPAYQAEMKILVRRGRMDAPVTPAPTPSPAFQREEVSEEELNSQAELLKDDDILRAVVLNTGATKRERWYDRYIYRDEEARLARSVRRLAGRLQAEPLRRSNLIAVAYTAHDPAEAAAVLQALARAYLERQQRVRRPTGQYQFFDQQVAESRRGLLEAEFRLLDFGSDQGVVSAPLERDMALQKLSDAEANDRQTKVAVAETRERIRGLEAKLKALPERTVTLIRNSDNPQLAEKLKSRLLELQLKRTELLSKFQPSYRLVQEVDQQIAETKASIAAEEQSPLREQTSNQDPNHEWAKAELLKAQVELGTLEAHGQATGIQVAGYRDMAQQLGANAIRQGQLMEELKSAEQKYLLYLGKREEARIEDALDQGGIVNVAVAQEARPPALPARAAWVFGLFGLLLGGTVGISAAFAADYFNPSFRTPDEVMAYLGTPVLASLPTSAGLT